MTTTEQNELAQLEAERNRLLSMIAYHKGPYSREAIDSVPIWHGALIASVISGVVIAALLGLSDDRFSLYLIAWMVLPASLVSGAYILARGSTVFGIKFDLATVIGAIYMAPTGQPAGEPEALQRLAHCDARIRQLKTDRS